MEQATSSTEVSFGKDGKAKTEMLSMHKQEQSTIT